MDTRMTVTFDDTAFLRDLEALRDCFTHWLAKGLHESFGRTDELDFHDDELEDLAGRLFAMSAWPEAFRLAVASGHPVLKEHCLSWLDTVEELVRGHGVARWLVEVYGTVFDDSDDDGDGMLRHAPIPIRPVTARELGRRLSLDGVQRHGRTPKERRKVKVDLFVGTLGMVCHALVRYGTPSDATVRLAYLALSHAPLALAFLGNQPGCQEDGIDFDDEAIAVDRYYRELQAQADARYRREREGHPSYTRLVGKHPAVSKDADERFMHDAAALFECMDMQPGKDGPDIDQVERDVAEGTITPMPWVSDPAWFHDLAVRLMGPILGISMAGAVREGDEEKLDDLCCEFEPLIMTVKGGGVALLPVAQIHFMAKAWLDNGNRPSLQHEVSRLAVCFDHARLDGAAVLLGRRPGGDQAALCRMVTALLERRDLDYLRDAAPLINPNFMTTAHNRDTRAYIHEAMGMVA
ncbi:MAG: hypothetical protein UHD09_09180 [Bifidobacterium sp.]|nr:hypothetical protein [Bifidobacterium sp.]